MKIFLVGGRSALVAGEDFFHFLENSGDLPKATSAFVSAGEQTLAGADKQDSAGLQALDIFLRGGVQPHLAIHCWSDDERRACGERDGGERIVCDPARELGDEVRRGGCDEKQIGIVRERDVAGMPGFFFIENSSRHRISREGLESERGDELRGGAGHHDMHLEAVLREAAREVGGLVTGNRAANAEDDIFFLHQKES